MPAYEYECRECGGHFERRQKMSEPEVAACPACGGGVRRLISGGAGAITGRGGPSAVRPCEATGTCEMPTAMGCGAGCACGH
jgi:putative FmdB family regulatory protein